MGHVSLSNNILQEPPQKISSHTFAMNSSFLLQFIWGPCWGRIAKFWIPLSSIPPIIYCNIVCYPKVESTWSFKQYNARTEG